MYDFAGVLFRPLITLYDRTVNVRREETNLAGLVHYSGLHLNPSLQLESRNGMSNDTCEILAIKINPLLQSIHNPSSLNRSLGKVCVVFGVSRKACLEMSTFTLAGITCI